MSAFWRRFFGFSLIGITTLCVILLTAHLFQDDKGQLSVQLPYAEAKFIGVVSSAQANSQKADNDMQRGGIKADRDKSLCARMDSPEVKDWIGTVTNIDSNSDGRGVLGIQIAPGVTIKTWNNALSDIVHGTLIEPGSSVFKSASSMKSGQLVTFSGTFFPGTNGSCIEESSLTLKGNVESPEFIFKFSNISAYDVSKHREAELTSNGAEAFGKWTAMSHTAYAITGNVEISHGRIAMQNNTYPLTLVRELNRDELQDSASAVLGVREPASQDIKGLLYRTSIPATAHFVNGSIICKPDSAKWVLVLITHGDGSNSTFSDWIHLAFFSSDAEPILHADVIDSSCGTYSYERTPVSTPH